MLMARQGEEGIMDRPGYVDLLETGVLAQRAQEARARLRRCSLCPRECGVDRLAGRKGFCRTGAQAVVASYGPHFGEESVLVGRGGSGTIFFSFCNLGCIFCQNYALSHLGEGVESSARELAAMMLRLKQQGCHNINLVTPSHVVPQILEALVIAAGQGLDLPLVYNSSGYDSLATLHLLRGVVDVYMPDFKFWSAESSRKYLAAPDYPERAREAIREMHRQVGDLRVTEDGTAARGLLIRHLVMPGGEAESRRIMEFIAQEISPATYVNVMGQYHPCGEAFSHPPLDRPVCAQEHRAALQAAEDAGLLRLDGGPNLARIIRWLSRDE